MFCGAGGFSHMDDDGHPRPPPAPTKKKSFNKNPYSTRGLDKFSTLLTELESRRQKILSQVGAQGVPVVLRFVYKSTQDWIPVVVKLPPPALPEKPPVASKASLPAHSAAETKNSVSSAMTSSPEAAHLAAKDQKKVIARRRPAFSWGSAVGRTKRDMGGFLYSVIVLALILLCLAASGKTFAICCTSVLFYVLPGLPGNSPGGCPVGTGCGAGVRKSMQKREYARKASDKRLLPPGDVAA